MTGKVCVKIVLTSLQPRGDRSNSAERVAPEPPDLCVFYPLSHRRTLLQTATSTRDNSTCPLTPTFTENTRICRIHHVFCLLQKCFCSGFPHFRVDCFAPPAESPRGRVDHKTHHHPAHQRKQRGRAQTQGFVVMASFTPERVENPDYSHHKEEATPFGMWICLEPARASDYLERPWAHAPAPPSFTPPPPPTLSPGAPVAQNISLTAALWARTPAPTGRDQKKYFSL